MKPHILAVFAYLAIIGAVVGQNTTNSSSNLNATTTMGPVITGESSTTAATTSLLVNSSIHSTITTTTITTSLLVNSSTQSTTTTTTTVFDGTTTKHTRDSNQNCSSCISNFETIYQSPNSTSVSQNYSNPWINCSQSLHPSNDSCYSLVRNNCSDIISVLYNTNSNVSYGLACSDAVVRVIRWLNCPVESPEAKMINNSNTAFCELGNFNCSLDRNGILKIDKKEVLEPYRKSRNCAIPTTARPTIPLLPNPVGPSAITAIVVLICLFIVGVLAAFFFWPKCHNASLPPPTPKKKPPPTEAFNVAYSSSSASNVSVIVPPSQFARGPAAA